MVFIILLVLALLLVLVFLPGRYLNQQVGIAAQMGPRDALPVPSVKLARSRRALANLQETLPIFLTLAVLSLVLREQGWISLAGAWLYFTCRIGHAICYIGGFAPWRSLFFLMAMVGLAIMVGPLLQHMWH